MTANFVFSLIILIGIAIVFLVPSQPNLCTEEAKVCPDGSAVGRDSSQGCEFFPCPDTTFCTEEAKVCPDGSVVRRNPALGCEFDPCPAVDRCALKPKEGPCEAAIQRFYFDAPAGQCKVFFWGGCEGVVPFQTLDECQQSCESPSIECETDADCPQIVCVTTPCPPYTCVDNECVLPG